LPKCPGGPLRLNGKSVMVQLNAIPDWQFSGHIDRISEIASLDGA
jgi:hypothetical protein